MLGKYAETSIIQRSGQNVAKSSVSLLLIATHKTRPSSVSKFRSVRCARYFDYSYRLTVTTATANTTTTITITTIVSRKTKTKCLIIRNMIDICYNNDGISMSNFVLLSPSSSKHSIPFDVRQIDIVSVGAYGRTFSHASNFTFILLLGWSIWWWSADNAQVECSSVYNSLLSHFPFLLSICEESVSRPWWTFPVGEIHYMREWRLFSLSWLPRDRWIIKIGNVIGVLRSDWLARRGFKGCIRTCVPNCFARWKFYLLLSGETETHTKHDHQRHNYGVIANTFYLIATLMRISRSNVYYDTI